LLEGEISENFYKRDPRTGLPFGWIKIMKESIASSLYTFATTRMLSDYVNQMYRPAGLA
jgi:starch phosphorylase